MDRVNKIAISSALGDPSDPRTWSSAPANLANALLSLGAEVTYIDSSVAWPRRARYAVAAWHTLFGASLLSGSWRDADWLTSHGYAVT